MSQTTIAVLSGGISGEREVSQRSAAALFEALRQDHPTELFDVNQAAIPVGLDPERHVVLSALHGIFGENGEMQELLDEAGFTYAGSDAASSRLCMDKTATKRVAGETGVRTAPGLVFPHDHPPEPSRVIAEIGEDLVLKPNNEGSSLGLAFAKGEAELRRELAELSPKAWMVERRVSGRELTVGVLHGRALGVVEILPRSGHYDYASKYTKGMTEFRFPAELSEEVSAELRQIAETVFHACGCRDFARVDFMYSESGEPFFLEINTIPGLTETSLLPKSAQCEGIDFRSLSGQLVASALNRFTNEIVK